MIPGVVLAEEIGAGGFATVYRGTQTVIGRDVAVKVDTRRLTAERDRRRFQREITALGTVAAHPNIVSLYDAGIAEDDHPYLVMELCTGGSYGQRIKRSGSIGLAETIEVGIAIADALAAAHASGILHRDVKPGNLLISQYGNPLLADFGLAALPRPGYDVSVTLESLTPAYSAPETFALKPPTAAADVFGLGTTLYAMLQGRAPHSDPSGQPPSLPHLLYLLNSPLPALPGVPESVMHVLWQATAATPEDRYHDAVSLRDALRRLRPGQAGGHPSPGGVSDTATQRPTLPGATPTLSLPTTSPSYEWRSASTGPHRAANGPSGQGLSRTGPLAPGDRGQRTGSFSTTDGSRATGPFPHVDSGPRTPSPADHTVRKSLLVTDADVSVPGARQRQSRRRGYAIAAAVVVLLVGIAAAVVLPTIGSTGSAVPPEAAPSGTTVASVPLLTAVLNAPTSSAQPGTDTMSTALVSPTPPTTAPTTTAALPSPGECFGGLVVISDMASATPVGCESPHYYESFATGLLAADVDGVSMTQVRADPEVVETCTTEALATYLGDDAEDDLTIEVLPPSEARFLAGDRAFRCLATEVGAGEVTGSLGD